MVTRRVYQHGITWLAGVALHTGLIRYGRRVHNQTRAVLGASNIARLCRLAGGVVGCAGLMGCASTLIDVTLPCSINEQSVLGWRYNMELNCTDHEVRKKQAPNPADRFDKIIGKP